MSIKREIQLMRSSVARVVRILADKDVSVTHIGTRAFCSWDPITGALKGMNIPQIPDNATLDFLQAIQGFVDHEVGHVLFTDSEALVHWIKELNGRVTRGEISKRALSGLAQLQNVIEDIYIENSIRAKFRGSKDNLRNVTIWVAENSVAPEVDKQIAAGNMRGAAMGLIVAVIRTMGGAPGWDSLRPRYESLWAQLESMLEPFRSAIEALDSTRSAIALTEAIYECFDDSDKSSKDPSDAEPEEGNEDLFGTPKKGDAEEEGESEDASDSGRLKEKDPDKEKSGGGEDKGESGADEDEGEADEVDEKGDSVGESPFSSEDFEDVKDSDELMEDALSKRNEEFFAGFSVANGPFVPAFTDLDFLGDYITTKGTEVDKLQGFIESAVEYSHVLQSQLEKLFVARKNHAWQTALRSGRLNGAALHRLAVNDDRVFRKRIATRHTDSAVMLLNDLSGSMSRDKLGPAMMTSLIFTKVLSRINVNHEILGFTTGLLDGRYMDMTAKLRLYEEIEKELRRQAGLSPSFAEYMARFSRTKPLVTYIFKPFGAPMTVAREMAMADAALTRCGRLMKENADGDSLLMAAQRLLQQPQERKIMLVMSDGEPSAGADRRVEASHLKNAIKDISRTGIQIFGIGIQSQCVAKFYPDYAVLNDVNEMPALVLGKLRDYLLK